MTPLPQSYLLHMKRRISLVKKIVSMEAYRIDHVHPAQCRVIFINFVYYSLL